MCYGDLDETAARQTLPRVRMSADGVGAREYRVEIKLGVTTVTLFPFPRVERGNCPEFCSFVAVLAIVSVSMSAFAQAAVTKYEDGDVLMTTHPERHFTTSLTS